MLLKELCPEGRLDSPMTCQSWNLKCHWCGDNLISDIWQSMQCKKNLTASIQTKQSINHFKTAIILISRECPEEVQWPQNRTQTAQKHALARKFPEAFCADVIWEHCPGWAVALHEHYLTWKNGSHATQVNQLCGRCQTMAHATFCRCKWPTARVLGDIDKTVLHTCQRKAFADFAILVMCVCWICVMALFQLHCNNPIEHGTYPRTHAKPTNLNAQLVKGSEESRHTQVCTKDIKLRCPLRASSFASPGWATSFVFHLQKTVTWDLTRLRLLHLHCHWHISSESEWVMSKGWQLCTLNCKLWNKTGNHMEFDNRSKKTSQFKLSFHISFPDKQMVKTKGLGSALPLNCHFCAECLSIPSDSFTVFVELNSCEVESKSKLPATSLLFFFE